MGRILFFGFLWVTGVLFSAHCQEKYEVSVCAFFKDESAYLQEWIEYHQMIGVDHFYLYNNSSCDQSMQVLRPYIQSGLVTVVYWPNLIPEYLSENLTHFVFSTQLPAYENAAKYLAYGKTEWLCFLNPDEFIVPMNCENIKEIVGKQKAYGAIELVNTQHFRVNYSGSAIRQYVIESVARVGEVIPVELKMRKTLFRPECYIGFEWPPYQCRFRAGTEIYRNCADLQLNKYTQRMQGRLNFAAPRRKLTCDLCSFSECELQSVLEAGFEIEDHDHRILKLVPKLKQRMMQQRN